MSYDPNLSRRGGGPREQERRKRERKTKRSRRGLFSAVLVVALVAGAAAAYFSGLTPLKPRGADKPSPSGPEATETWLVGGGVDNAASDWLTVVAFQKRTKEGVFLYIPRSVYAEIPGHGLETLDKSLALGGRSLFANTTSNLLGVRIDKTILLPADSIAPLIDKLGGIDVSVSEKLTRTEATGRVIVEFSEGRQHLDGAKAARFLAFTNEDGDEVARGARHALVWNAIFKVKSSRVAGAFRESASAFIVDAEAADVARMFEQFAAAKSGSVVFETLPIRSTGVDKGVQFYAVDRESTQRLIEEYLAGSIIASGEGKRVEILNGNGRPGIGQQVSEQLIPKGYRIILNQNAKRFNFTKSQIVVYSDSARSLALGRDVQSILGVGEVIVSRQKQTLVDVTIVVGADYLEKG